MQHFQLQPSIALGRLSQNCDTQENPLKVPDSNNRSQLTQNQKSINTQQSGIRQQSKASPIPTVQRKFSSTGNLSNENSLVSPKAVPPCFRSTGSHNTSSFPSLANHFHKSSRSWIEASLRATESSFPVVWLLLQAPAW